MWIVRLALRRPYTFVVVALLIVLLGAVTIMRTPTDIFPEVSIPVVSVIWSLTGLPVTDMEARIITTTERAFTTSVNDIEHIESQSMPGVGVIKVFFHPNAQIGAAVAQVTAISQTLLRTMPPGTTPPLILQYSASSVPILQLSVGSKTLTEVQLFDYAQNFIRTQLATVQGAEVTGGVSIAAAHDVAEMTLIPRPPRGRDEVPVQIARLLHAHGVILKAARVMARQAAEAGDDGTNDLLVSQVIRTNERQVWFVSEHLEDTPLVASER